VAEAKEEEVKVKNTPIECEFLEELLGLPPHRKLILRFN